MKIKSLRTLATEIFKTLNDIKPNYMKEVFYLSPHEIHKKYDLLVHSHNTTKYGNHSLRFLGPHIWNSIPEEIKKPSSLNSFKNCIKGWCSQKSKCYLCQTYCTPALLDQQQKHSTPFVDFFPI